MDQKKIMHYTFTSISRYDADRPRDDEDLTDWCRRKMEAIVNSYVGCICDNQTRFALESQIKSFVKQIYAETGILHQYRISWDFGSVKIDIFDDSRDDVGSDICG